MAEGKKHWIEDAVQKPGSLAAAAKRAGKATAAYAEGHADDPGKMGRRARLAEMLLNLREKTEKGNK